MRKTFASVLRTIADRFDPPQVFEPMLASTQFTGSGLVVNVYGCDLEPPEGMSWTIRNGGLL
jgi:hypothetical protein